METYKDTIFGTLLNAELKTILTKTITQYFLEHPDKIEDDISDCMEYKDEAKQLFYLATGIRDDKINYPICYVDAAKDLHPQIRSFLEWMIYTQIDSFEIAKGLLTHYKEAKKKSAKPVKLKKVS